MSGWPTASAHASSYAWQTAAGRTKKEIIRLLKRAIAREVFRLLTTQVDVPGIADLQSARQAKNITLTAAENRFGVWPNVISHLERGLRRDDAYRATATTLRNVACVVSLIVSRWKR